MLNKFTIRKKWIRFQLIKKSFNKQPNKYWSPELKNIRRLRKQKRLKRSKRKKNCFNKFRELKPRETQSEIKTSKNKNWLNQIEETSSKKSVMLIIKRNNKYKNKD